MKSLILTASICIVVGWTLVPFAWRLDRDVAPTGNIILMSVAGLWLVAQGLTLLALGG